MRISDWSSDVCSSDLVEVDTLQWNGGLVANEVNLKSKDLRTASMIHTGTDQRFAQQTAATEALRGRVGDIDQYNIKGTTNVNFDTGQAVLSEQAKEIGRASCRERVCQYV